MYKKSNVISSLVLAVSLLLGLLSCSDRRVPSVPRKSIEETIQIILSTATLSHNDVSRLCYRANSAVLHSLDSLPPVSAGLDKFGKWEYATAQERQNRQQVWMEQVRAKTAKVCEAFDTIFVMEDTIDYVSYQPDKDLGTLHLKSCGMMLPAFKLRYKIDEERLPIKAGQENLAISCGFIGHRIEEVIAGGLSYNFITGNHETVQNEVQCTSGSIDFLCPLDIAKKLDIANRKGVVRYLGCIRKIQSFVFLQKYVGDLMPSDSLFTLTTRLPDDADYMTIWISGLDTLVIPPHISYREGYRPIYRYLAGVKNR
jgi:hypothetical protein